MFKWPLNISQLSFLDRIKIATFILTSDKWTMGEKVAEFEKQMASYISCKYAVLTSSGSTANTILAMYLKDTQKNKSKNIVIFPSTTWITSVSPFIREGFEPHFIDINLNDFSMDLNKLEEYLKINSEFVACVFVTSLIGFVPNISRLKAISEKYNVKIMMDNCENHLGGYLDYNISQFFTSTTSLYFGHQICGVESGFIFTNDENEYHYFLMARNHGMVRSLPESIKEKYKNYSVDERFDFNILGNNFRTTDINAYIGLLDFKRRWDYFHKRRSLYNLFCANLDSKKYYLPFRDNILYKDVPFCLPIIRNQDSIVKFQGFPDSVLWEDSNSIGKAVSVCKNLGIETRPILSGNLLKHTVFKNYIYNDKDFLNSNLLHDYGFYVGLHPKVKEKDIINLTTKLNKI